MVGLSQFFCVFLCLETIRQYCIQNKLINIVKLMYADSMCSVPDDGDEIDWFDVKTGVKQGCVLC